MSIDFSHANNSNGYVQNAKNPNIYVNLETGKERNLYKKWKLDWLILWFFLALFFTHYVKLELVKIPNQPRQSSRSLVNYKFVSWVGLTPNLR